MAEILPEAGGGGGSHIDMAYIYVASFWGAFSQNLVSDWWVFIRDEGAQIKKSGCILSKLF